jgi:hypothetical protein
MPAGAARPRGSKEKTPSYPHRWLAPPAFRCRPSAPEERDCDPQVRTKSRAILASHGRDAGATKQVS